MRTMYLMAFGLVVLAGTSWADELPTTVGSYYDDWNFVVLNSRPAERQAIWQQFKQQDKVPNSPAGTEILRRMERIDATMIVLESTMPMQYSTMSPVRPELLIPDSRWFGTVDEIVLEVSIMRFPNERTLSVSDSEWPVRNAGYPEDLPVMGHYTDRWHRVRTSWQLHRSLVVHVSSR